MWEMDMAHQVQNLDKAVCISYGTDTLGKDMNPTILPPSTGKQLDRQIGLCNLGMATSLEEGKLWIQICKTLFKNWPCIASYLCGAIGQVHICGQHKK